MKSTKTLIGFCTIYLILTNAYFTIVNDIRQSNRHNQLIELIKTQQNENN